MTKENIVLENPQKIYLNNIVETGRRKAMSLLNFSLNIHDFHIDVQVKKDEEREKERFVKRIEHQKRMKEVFEQRERLDIEMMRMIKW